MNFVWNLKIATKIVSLLALLGIVVMAVALYGSRTLSKADAGYSVLTDHVLPTTTKMARVARLTVAMDLEAYRVMAYDGASAAAQAADSGERESYEKAVALLQAASLEVPALADKLRPIRSGVDEIHALSRQAIALGLQNRNEEARLVLMKSDAALQRLNTNLVGLNDKTIEEGKATSALLSANSASTSLWMLLGGAIAVILAVGGGIIVARVGITAPLNQLKATMESLAGGATHVEVPGTDRRDEIGEMAKTVLVFRDAAVALEAATAAKQRAEADQAVVVSELTTNLRKLSEGDLTARIDANVASEYTELKANFNDALTTLGGTIGAVSTGADAIRTGSMEIAQASEDLARRTESNAASLEETSAALVQIDGRLKASLTASEKTVLRADQAIATVDSGRSMAGQAVAAMNRVRESAKGIDDVIEGLDKIAFQTRVLAMNAAVEAGRAGDAGRGFAVVADLVSALAMRAEEEAKRARDQLTVTQAEVVSAVDRVQQVDGALSAISGDVGEVHALLRSMASDNEAQASGISQITVAVGAMDQSVQQNAAMVEETSAAARNLTVEVNELAARTAAFTTGDAPMKPRSNRVEMASAPKPARAAASPKTSKRAVSMAHVNGHANGHAAGADSDWASF